MTKTTYLQTTTVDMQSTSESLLLPHPSTHNPPCLNNFPIYHRKLTSTLLLHTIYYQEHLHSNEMTRLCPTRTYSANSLSSRPLDQLTLTLTLSTPSLNPYFPGYNYADVHPQIKETTPPHCNITCSAHHHYSPISTTARSFKQTPLLHSTKLSLDDLSSISMQPQHHHIFGTRAGHSPCSPPSTD